MVIEKLYFVYFLDFIWTWIFNLLNFLDYGWTWTEYSKFRFGSECISQENSMIFLLLTCSFEFLFCIVILLSNWLLGD